MEGSVASQQLAGCDGKAERRAGRYDGREEKKKEREEDEKEKEKDFLKIHIVKEVYIKQ